MPHRQLAESRLTEEESNEDTKKSKGSHEEADDNKKLENISDDLTTQELNQFISRTLVVANPYQNLNQVEFNFKEGEFQRVKKFSREILLYEIEGSLRHKDDEDFDEEIEEKTNLEEENLESDEEWKEKITGLKENQKKMIMEKLLIKSKKKDEIIETKKEESETESENDEEEQQEMETAEGEAASSPIPEEEIITTTSKKKLVNRFNFSDRSALTYTPLSRHKTTQTIPNPKAHLSGQVSQWVIYDAYMEDYNKTLEAREKERMSKMVMANKKEEQRSMKKPLREEDIISKKMASSLKILERMLNQNTYDILAQDCQFYEDPADKYRPDEGVLLPLWEFSYLPAKNMSVTEIKWCPVYKDLFGVTFGVMDFVETENIGFLCIFTLKNPSYPEFIQHFDSSAICLDFHPRKCHFVCLGLRDGSVAAYNMVTGVCCRSAVEKNHLSLVSSVLWCDDERDRQLGFFSAGADGRICKWLVLQSGELLHSPVITLYLEKNDFILNNLANFGSETSLRAVPTCLVFHPKDPEIFMVGTSLGTIYKCSISYASTYFYQMKSHELPVHRISFNNFISNIFATCSADWRLKIWEDGRLEPLFVFNLESSVGDTQWAPYSSTVIAAVTSLGKVCVYDLNLNKYDPACAQYVVSSEENISATRFTFNPYGLKMPLLVVGDSKGVITTLKISPNLRLKPKKPKKSSENQVPLDDFGQEVKKLEKILSYVREPNASSLVFDVTEKQNVEQ